MLDLYLIRHAESEMNLTPHLVGGRSNYTPLTSLGRAQAYFLQNHFVREMFDQVYASPATRTVDTATIALDSFVIDSRLLELSQGDWEGRLREEVYTPDVLAEIKADNWNFKAPNGESQREVEERMLSWAGSLDGVVAAVTHGMAIKCLLRGVMGFDASFTYRIAIDNASITHLAYDSGWRLLCVNETGHLK